ncbi:MAG TPA: hypothetical protein PK490_19745 [Prosthecobacter sp.]|nr:hypothetical protein [Prosthecobacter sp.]HRK16523.1 hypothetical protein [Prosthecobacter sp.]
MIRTTASRLRKGQRVKLRTSAQMWKCLESCAESKDGYACVAIGYHKQWLSPGYKVQVPLEDDPVLGGAALP